MPTLFGAGEPLTDRMAAGLFTFMALLALLGFAMTPASMRTRARVVTDVAGALGAVFLAASYLVADGWPSSTAVLVALVSMGVSLTAGIRDTRAMQAQVAENSAARHQPPQG